MGRKPKRTAAQRGKTRANRRPKTDEDGDVIPRQRAGSNSSSDSDSSDDDDYRQQPFFGSVNADSDRATEAAMLGRVMRAGASAGSIAGCSAVSGTLLGTVAEEPGSGSSNGDANVSAALAPADLDGVLPANYGMGGGASSSSSQQVERGLDPPTSNGAENATNTNSANGGADYAPEGFFDEEQYDLDKEKRAEAYLKVVRQEAQEWDLAQKKKQKEAKKRRKEEEQEEKRDGKRRESDGKERENVSNDVNDDQDKGSPDRNQKKKRKTTEDENKDGAGKNSSEAMAVDELSESLGKISMDHLEIVEAQAEVAITSFKQVRAGMKVENGPRYKVDTSEILNLGLPDPVTSSSSTAGNAATRAAASSPPAAYLATAPSFDPSFLISRSNRDKFQKSFRESLVQTLQPAKQYNLVSALEIAVDKMEHLFGEPSEDSDSNSSAGTATEVWTPPVLRQRVVGKQEGQGLGQPSSAQSSAASTSAAPTSIPKPTQGTVSSRITAVVKKTEEQAAIWCVFSVLVFLDSPVFFDDIQAVLQDAKRACVRRIRDLEGVMEEVMEAIPDHGGESGLKGRIRTAIAESQAESGKKQEGNANGVDGVNQSNTGRTDSVIPVPEKFDVVIACARSGGSSGGGWSGDVVQMNADMLADLEELRAIYNEYVLCYVVITRFFKQR